MLEASVYEAEQRLLRITLSLLEPTTPSETMAIIGANILLHGRKTQKQSYENNLLFIV